MEIQQTTDRALAGLPNCEQAAELCIDSIIIAHKEQIIKTADLLPNVVQRIHELSPHAQMRPALSVEEVLARRNQLFLLAGICLNTQLGEDFL